MLSQREVTAAIGSTAYGSGGDKLGTVEHFFVDDRTGEPTWVAVTTGLFGTRHSVVPAREATFAEGHLRLPVTADAVKNAPAMAGDHLDPGEEAELRRHYGLGESTAPDLTAPARSADADTVAVPVTPPVPATSETTARHAAPDVTAPDVTAPHAAPNPAPASDGAMVRSEERLRVSTELVPERRVRVVKYVVTEEVQVTVPIRREEIRIEELPLGATDGVPAGSLAAGTLPEEIVLHTERPVIGVEVVPVERVRLRTELVQSQETVSGQVRREQVVVDQDTLPPRDAV
ncbi:PRC-barrel domain-containing protein [Blastococcus sp. LR1]|uniref:PRC-barrel domain-containing protein n=1 Tax=Blastococcus sp. LR1 TaxID=2877000 RepID=UPI001CCE1E2D|nr:PRC-barrel domain-containing protein [Blastococcus sp. LR1]MCA0147017.1 PRC-barrel domain-containing protein [Blastococcus sp. LR1]